MRYLEVSKGGPPREWPLASLQWLPVWQECLRRLFKLYRNKDCDPEKHTACKFTLGKQLPASPHFLKLPYIMKRPACSLWSPESLIREDFGEVVSLKDRTSSRYKRSPLHLPSHRAAPHAQGCSNCYQLLRAVILQRPRAAVYTLMCVPAPHFSSLSVLFLSLFYEQGRVCCGNFCMQLTRGISDSTLTSIGWHRNT